MKRGTARWDDAWGVVVWERLSAAWEPLDEQGQPSSLAGVSPHAI